MAPRIAIAADDNTGATDAAGMLTSFGAKALLVLDTSLLDELQDMKDKGEEKKSPDKYDVVVLSTRIRSIPPEDAYNLTYKVLKSLVDLGFDILQLKYCSTFDSTPEGNIGKSLDAARDLLDFSSTIVCPALPVNGRTTYMGYHFVHGLLLSESPLAAHPLNPMTDSNLLRWLGYQTEKGVGLISLETIRKGTDAVTEARKKLEAEGSAYHVCDALEQEDIDLTVQAYAGTNIPEEGADFPEIPEERPTAPGAGQANESRNKIFPDWRPIFLSGGSGVSLSLGHLYYSDLPPLDFSRELQRLSPVLVVISGSESPTAQSQREYAKAHGFTEVTINPLDILEGSPIIGYTAERIAAAYREGKSVVAALERENGGSVEEVNKAAREKGLSPVETGELIGTFLGKIAARLVHSDAIERLLVAGGETSGAVCRECGFKALEVGLPIDPGVPYCFPVDFSSPGSNAAGFPGRLTGLSAPGSPEQSASAAGADSPGQSGATPRLGAPLVILKSGNFGQEDLYPRAARLGSTGDTRG